MLHGNPSALRDVQRDAADMPPQQGLAGEAEARGAAPFNEDDLVALLPQLNRYARFLTRNRADADDLVQDTIARMLAGALTYRPGTNFRAWACTVMRNRFLSVHARGVGRETSIDDVEQSFMQQPPSQLDGLEQQDLMTLFMRLPVESRSVLVLAGTMSYEQIALASGCAVGTIKSRVHRARLMLRSMLGVAYAPQDEGCLSLSGQEASPLPRPAAMEASGERSASAAA
jgi:RNA polymerase sigma-70 factor (ECF subfamily)